MRNAMVARLSAVLAAVGALVAAAFNGDFIWP